MIVLVQGGKHFYERGIPHRKGRTAMPIYENGPVQIHYEEAGSGFPLLVIPGGGLNATIPDRRG